MGIVSPTQVSDGTTMDAADVNSPINTLANEFNGNIDNSNIKSAAAIDASKVAGGITGMFGGWTSWTPSLTNITGGTTNYAKYIQIGKTVHFRFKYTLAGAGVSGVITIGTPVTMNSDYLSTDVLDCSVVCYDLSATTHYVGQAITASTSTITLKVLHTDGSRGNVEVSSSSDPFTFATGDIVYVSGTYEAA